MSGAPIQSDSTLWHALRTRRRHREQPAGLDATANRWLARAKHSRKNMAFLDRQAQAVVDQESQWKDLTDAQLDERAMQVREVMACGKQTPQQLVAAFAAVREIAWRAAGLRPYKVQIMGAMGLYHGLIVEMVTGEGKTLTAAVAASVLGWRRRPIHVVTVNDYLAERDSDEQSPIYRRCGLSAGAVIGETPEPQRHRTYRLPIVYLTQKELVADWLRDQLKLGRVADPVSTRWMQDGQQGRRSAVPVLIPGLHVAIVDEVDAVLIDEAVTPLIIAQPRQEDAQSVLYLRARDLAQPLVLDEDFTLEPAIRRATLTRVGRQRVQEALTDDDHGVWHADRRREELIEQALVAAHCYLHKQHYQIMEDKIVIVDEYTGRFMQDRQWQHGLHQAVEAKHSLEVTADRDTLASLSFQRFFQQYPHLCGMTGTAADARPEMETTYGLPVRIIPTHRPIKRVMLPALMFATAAQKWEAAVNEIAQMHGQGRPVLIGTRSVEASEHFSELLTARGLEHQVLNAVHHKLEAQIVTGAGQPGAITVATNMAGRGTDIKLGAGVAERGGLHVVLTERYTARRVDRQLVGRAGRQGDPGSARVIVSLEDDLLLKFAPILAAGLRRRFAGRTTPLPAWASRLFDHAQRRAQKQAFKSRLNVLKHDQELDKTLPI